MHALLELASVPVTPQPSLEMQLVLLQGKLWPGHPGGACGRSSQVSRRPGRCPAVQPGQPLPQQYLLLHAQVSSLILLHTLSPNHTKRGFLCRSKGQCIQSHVDYCSLAVPRLTMSWPCQDSGVVSNQCMQAMVTFSCNITGALDPGLNCAL